MERGSKCLVKSAHGSVKNPKFCPAHSGEQLPEFENSFAKSWAGEVHCKQQLFCTGGAMKIFRDRKIVVFAAVLILGLALAPYSHAMNMHPHSMEMGDCSASVHCLACGNSLPSSGRVDPSLPPSLDAMVSLHIQKVAPPTEKHYHPPG